MSNIYGSLVFFCWFSKLRLSQPIGFFYNSSIPQFEFATQQIGLELEKQGYTSETKPLSELSDGYQNNKIILAIKDANK